MATIVNWTWIQRNQWVMWRVVFAGSWLLLSLARIGAASVLPGNMLPNPEFEVDGNRDGLPDGWLRFGSAPQDARWDTSNPVSGDRHLLLRDQRAGDWTAWTTQVKLPREVPELEFQWSWGYDVTSDPVGDGFHLNVYWEGDGFSLGENGLMTQGDHPTYVTVNKVLVVPDGTDTVRLEFATGNRDITTGTLWVDDVSMSVPGAGTFGDLNQDGKLNAGDLDELTTQFLRGTHHEFFDLNHDAVVDVHDREYWIEWLKLTYFGDANMDFEFNTTDLIVVFQAGEYEDGIQANSRWVTGDWSGDFEFDSADVIIAFQAGGFERGMRAAVVAVPEPRGHALWLLGWAAAVGPWHRGDKRRGAIAGR